jgi:hypothetical protein
VHRLTEIRYALPSDIRAQLRDGASASARARMVCIDQVKVKEQSEHNVAPIVQLNTRRAGARNNLVHTATRPHGGVRRQQRNHGSAAPYK